MPKALNLSHQETLETDFERIDPRHHIIIKGARVNNLKNLSVAIPRNKFVVITGVSGSGKSSLAFDTLFAEGQRMYVESLNSYARQFLGRMEKPDVDYIKGVSPAIAVEQKVSTRNTRSTVGTTTEIYDYLKLLYARIGQTISPVSGKTVRKDTIAEVVDFMEAQPDGSRYMILCPLRLQEGRSAQDELKIALQKGFTRVRLDHDQVYFIEELLAGGKVKPKLGTMELLIDRSSIQYGSEEQRFRLSDSVQTAFDESRGDCVVILYKPEQDAETHRFSDRFEADGLTFEEPTINLFSFNNPYGACRTCEGFGSVLGIDMKLVIPDQSLSVFEGAIAPWNSDKMREEWLKPLLRKGIEFGFPIHRAYMDLNEEERELLLNGNEYFKGIHDFFEYVEQQLHKIQYRVMLSRYRGKKVCPDCRGSRLRKDAGYVKIGGHSIIDLVLLPIIDLHAFFKKLKISDYDQKVARRLLVEIENRLSYLLDVGLGYLTLNRLTATLSGGEFQRIKLATSLGSALVGSMYILDEPSIGLHPRDTQNLIRVLLRLKELGNTVIVVEHEEEVMMAADMVLDIGPDAGQHGGNLLFQGTPKELIKSGTTHTADYLSRRINIAVPKVRRRPVDFIQVVGARENNLKNINVKFPLNILSVVTGVSGSGKSTLVQRILSPAIEKFLNQNGADVGAHDRILGNLKAISQIEMINQSPIGKSSRSNPITYIKGYDHIRALMAEEATKLRKELKPGHFSFNVDGGRCDACQGEGHTVVEMQFMADIKLLCEECKGKRFKEEVLEVTHKGKNIHDILSMSVDEALIFFDKEQRIKEKLQPLHDVGLGYVGLGQSSDTLSGGEAQRVKLASFLSKGKRDDEHILFIFDEPTTGLHFQDVHKLLKAINALVDIGHTAIIIEHNMEVIKTADWIIDLGPEGGNKGGYLTFEGSPEDFIRQPNDSFTAGFLKKFLD